MTERRLAENTFRNTEPVSAAEARAEACAGVFSGEENGSKNPTIPIGVVSETESIEIVVPI